MSLSISLNCIRSFRIILFSARSRCYGVYFHAAACFHFGSSPCLTDFWKAPEQHLRQGWDYTFHILACHVFVVPFVRNVFDISTWPAAAAWSGNVWKRTSTWCRGQWHHQAFASCFRQGSPHQSTESTECTECTVSVSRVKWFEFVTFKFLTFRDLK